MSAWNDGAMSATPRNSAARPLFGSLVPDSVQQRDKSLPIFLGAMVGAAVGLYFYKRELDEMGDGDFAAPMSIAVYGGGGALVGGLLAFLLSSSGECKKERRELCP